MNVDRKHIRTRSPTEQDFIVRHPFATGSQTEQEAQLPLRSRASAMHFFVAKLLSIAVMTYSYVYHLRNLRPAHLLRT